MRRWVRMGVLPGAALVFALSCATGEEIDDEGNKGGFSGIGAATGTGGVVASGGFPGTGGGISAKGGTGGSVSTGCSGGSGASGGVSSGGAGGASAAGGSGGSFGGTGGSGGNIGGSSGKGGTGGASGGSGDTGGGTGGGTSCNATSNTCATAETLGTHCGDLECGSTVFNCKAASWLAFQTRTGKGSRWFKAKADECAGCCTDVEARIDLEVPAGMNYDLHIYSACGSEVASSKLGAGQKDSAAIYVGDDCFGGDSSFDYIVEVRYVSGTACTTDWKLTLQKTNC